MLKVPAEGSCPRLLVTSAGGTRWHRVAVARLDVDEGLVVLTGCGRRLSQREGMRDADFSPNLCARCWPALTNATQLGHLVVADEPAFDMRKMVTSWRLVVVDVAVGLRVSYAGTIDVAPPSGAGFDGLRSLHRYARAVRVSSVNVDGLGSTEELRAKVKLAASRSLFRSVARWVAQGDGTARSSVEVGRLLGWAGHESAGDDRDMVKRQRLELVANVVKVAPFGEQTRLVVEALEARYQRPYSDAYARELVLECRRPEWGLLPPAKPRGRPRKVTS